MPGLEAIGSHASAASSSMTHRGRTAGSSCRRTFGLRRHGLRHSRFAIPLAAKPRAQVEQIWSTTVGVRLSTYLGRRPSSWTEPSQFA